MPRTSYIYFGEFYKMQAGSTAADPKKTEIIAKIRSIYDAGTPLFTKEALEILSQELQQCKGGKAHQVLLNGLDGKAVNFKIETGVIQRAIDPTLELVFYVQGLRLIDITSRILT